MRAKDVEARNREVAETLPQRLFEPDADEVGALAGAADRAREREFPELTEMERKVFVSVEMEGVSPAELAQFRDFPSASTIRTHLRRARRKRGDLQ